MACSSCQQLAAYGGGGREFGGGRLAGSEVKDTLQPQNEARQAQSEARMRRGLIFAGALMVLYYVLR